LARVILDSGAVIALSKKDPEVRELVDQARARGDSVVVPAVVIAETTRGAAQDAPINLVLRDIGEFPASTAEKARKAGHLLLAYEKSLEELTSTQKAKRGNAAIDALVAAEAVLYPPAVIVTCDEDDFRRLIGNTPRTEIYSI